MWCGHTAVHWSPFPLFREDWRPRSVSAEWRGSETRCRAGMEGAPVVEGAPGAAAAAGKADHTDMATVMGTATATDHQEDPGPRECISSLWRREPAQWPSITLSRYARTASLSIARCLFSARITS